jgi:hypothetical protein
LRSERDRGPAAALGTSMGLMKIGVQITYIGDPEAAHSGALHPKTQHRNPLIPEYLH